MIKNQKAYRKRVRNQEVVPRRVRYQITDLIFSAIKTTNLPKTNSQLLYFLMILKNQTIKMATDPPGSRENKEIPLEKINLLRKRKILARSKNLVNKNEKTV